jgi:hypothetical protein
VEDSTSEVTTKAVGLDIEQKLAPSEWQHNTKVYFI